MSALYSLSHTTALEEARRRIRIRKLQKYVTVPFARFLSSGPSLRHLVSQHKFRWKGILPTAVYRRGREGIVDDIGLPEELEDIGTPPPKPKPGYSELNESYSFFDGVGDSRHYSWHEAGAPGRDGADVQHEETSGGRYINMLLLFLNSLRSGRWRSAGLKGVLHLVVVWGTGVSQTCQDALFASLPPSVPPDLVLFKIGGFILAAVIFAASALSISQRLRSEEEVKNGSKREPRHEPSFNLYDKKTWTPKKRKPPDANDYFNTSMFGAT